jgi:hypothetical protein
VISDYESATRSSVASKTKPGYEKNVVNAIETIEKNKNNLRYLDEEGNETT